MFKLILLQMQAQEAKDGVTADGKLVKEAIENEDGEACTLCKQIGDNLLVCSVSILHYVGCVYMLFNVL